MTTSTPVLDAQIDEINNILAKKTEDKAGFVRDINRAIIVNGDGRYDDLIQTPLKYQAITNDYGTVIDEQVIYGKRVANVTGDSLIGILCDMCKQLFD